MMRARLSDVGTIQVVAIAVYPLPDVSIDLVDWHGTRPASIASNGARSQPWQGFMLDLSEKH